MLLHRMRRCQCSVRLPQIDLALVAQVVAQEVRSGEGIGSSLVWGMGMGGGFDYVE